MRLTLLLLLAPMVAFADASTPPKQAAEPAAPKLIEYAQPSDGTKTTATTYEPGTRLFAVGDGRQLTAVERRADGRYVVDDQGRRATVGFLDVTPFAFRVGGRSVTVAFGADFKIHVHVAGGGDLAFEPAGQGYLSRKGGNVSAELVANVAPVPLVVIGSHPEACADFFDVYVSVVDGVPRQALELDGVADPPAMMSSSVKFDARAGTAVVTTRRSEDEGKKARVRRTRYRFDGTVFADVSKRPATRAK